jgi:DNA primase
MPFIPDQELEKLRSRADIVQVIGEKIPLKRAGRNFKGLCPFHSEKSPSFMVQPDKQIFHCFGCGEGGDVFSFLMKHDGLEFVEAVERLAERYGIILTKVSGESEDKIRKGREEKDLYFRINRLAALFFQKILIEDETGKRGRDYLQQREIKIEDEIVKESLLGYAPADGKRLTQLFQNKKVPMELAEKLGLIRKGTAGDYYDFFRDRLIFTITSAEGKVLGFSGRGIDDSVQPKYLNSPESMIYRKSDSLLGIQVARPAIRELDQVILVEGNFDLLRLQKAGLRNVVAPLGTALTDLQVRSLSRLTRNFVLIFDGDDAGIRAAERALRIFLPLGILPKSVSLPKGEDPDTFVRQKGGDALREIISLASPLLDIVIEGIFEKTKKDPQERRRFVPEIADLLSLCPGEVEKQMYFQRVADRFGLSVDVVRRSGDPKNSQKNRSARKESNFSASTGEDGGALGGIALPPIERTVLEVLLSGQSLSAMQETLFKEIEAEDFLHPLAGEVWRVLKEDYSQHREVDVGRILAGVTEAPVRKLLTELSIRGSRWQEEGGKAAADCVRQLRSAKMRGKLQELSREIRKAELEHDTTKIMDLMDQKNRLIHEMKQMTSLN